MYTFRYKLQSKPEARNDGSGGIAHDIYAQARDSTWEAGVWIDVPARHKSIIVPAEEIQTALAAGSPRQAYKNALATNLGTALESISGWDAADLMALMVANDAAAAAALAADEFILSVAPGGAYPVPFTL